MLDEQVNASHSVRFVAMVVVVGRRHRPSVPVDPDAADLLRRRRVDGPGIGGGVHLVRQRKVQLLVARIVMQLRLVEAVVLLLHHRLGRAHRHRAELLRLQDLRALLHRLLVVHRRERLAVDFEDGVVDAQPVLVRHRARLHLRDVDAAARRLVALDADAEAVVVGIGALLRLILARRLAMVAVAGVVRLL